ncbi:hypothetical protein PHYPSEUDO_003814 [Phytophthora pseudosyringae]|uniref:Uncharacterized protein n=1 Tax=Phytophthora pseudosyringae TaxID=221518 RepID=A0A8T1WJ50_9STRA|nr:hypothetical protein PHYPSEUDO_003814 [Phytophthora pseudosyringae]
MPSRDRSAQQVNFGSANAGGALRRRWHHITRTYFPIEAVADVCAEASRRVVARDGGVLSGVDSAKARLVSARNQVLTNQIDGTLYPVTKTRISFNQVKRGFRGPRPPRCWYSAALAAPHHKLVGCRPRSAKAIAPIESGVAPRRRSSCCWQRM